MTDLAHALADRRRHDVDSAPAVTDDPAWPTKYSTPGYMPAIPGADWMIEGCRFREVGREAISDTKSVVRLELADVEPGFGYQTVINGASDD